MKANDGKKEMVIRSKWSRMEESKYVTNINKAVFRGNTKLDIVCLHDQNKSGFFGGPAFSQPIRAF